MEHVVILINNQINIEELVDDIRGNQLKGFDTVLNKKIGVFSSHQIDLFIEEEEYHDLKILTKTSNQSLKSMSSGERKKALLNHLLKQDLDCLVLVNPYDNLDIQTQSELKDRFEKLGKTKQLVQILSRVDDTLGMTEAFYKLANNKLYKYSDSEDFNNALSSSKTNLSASIPLPLHPIRLEVENLVEFKGVSVSYDGNQILNNIDWTIKKNEFWELLGPNGSGKTTLLSMITGDSPKSYQQDVTLFGHKKGSGESVWDIKELLGYFTPAMTDRFRGYHTLDNMLISGLNDSIGLYQNPSDTELKLAHDWLKLIGLDSKANQYFHQLSLGEKRLLMLARAMLKHPPLLILDEPTSGLDDVSASFFIALVNKFAEESDSTIVFVSHRKEPGLDADKIFKLAPSPSSKGSYGEFQ